jgi:hypothetical protein
MGAAHLRSYFVARPQRGNELPNASSANASALYDPPTVTLIEGQTYQFKEGVLVGRKDHKFHSDYSYRRAVIIGEK